MFVTPGIWQIGPPRVELTPRHTSHPAHSKNFCTPLLYPAAAPRRYNHDFRGVVGVERWFCRSDEDWEALAERLKLTACPHCKVVGTLIRHGYLRGFDDSSRRSPGAPARR